MHGRRRGRQAGTVAVNPVASAAPPGLQAGQAGRSWPAAVALFFGAGVVPESVLTFNTPPLRLLTSPASLVFISAFYGSVALLVREFWRRTSAPAAAILLLGMAAGAVNEGIIAGTWYRVQYPGYALIGGLDPAAAAGLTVFHALASTIVPILLAELAFPRVAAAPWLPRPARAGCFLLLAATAATGFAAAGHRGQKLAVLGAVILAAVDRSGARGPAPGAGLPEAEETTVREDSRQDRPRPDAAQAGRRCRRGRVLRGLRRGGRPARRHRPAARPGRRSAAPHRPDGQLLRGRDQDQPGLDEAAGVGTGADAGSPDGRAVAGDPGLARPAGRAAGTRAGGHASGSGPADLVVVAPAGRYWAGQSLATAKAARLIAGTVITPCTFWLSPTTCRADRDDMPTGG